MNNKSTLLEKYNIHSDQEAIRAFDNRNNLDGLVDIKCTNSSDIVSAAWESVHNNTPINNEINTIIYNILTKISKRKKHLHNFFIIGPLVRGILSTVNIADIRKELYIYTISILPHNIFNLKEFYTGIDFYEKKIQLNTLNYLINICI